MTIAGFQPMTLLDYPGIIASLVFTQGCPFRCAYCHNPDLVPVKTSANPSIEAATVLDYLRAKKSMIEGVCITGGEPTLQPDLPDFIRQIRQLGMRVKLDTNGVHPRMIEGLIQNKLVDYFAMDLKHVWSRYPEVIGIPEPAVSANCQKTFTLIQDSGVAHEFRTTVYAGFHAKEDLVNIARQLKTGERYALQAIRYTKTLDPNIEHLQPINLEDAALHLRQAFPHLLIEVRA